MTIPPSDRVTLGTWPTPLEPAPRLAAAVGLRPDRLWLKRDDLTGLAGGGNKIRKLEWTLGAAIAAGADTVVTTGAPQSNHARLTAAAGARLGLAVVLVFPGAPPSTAVGNLLLDGLLGATILWTGVAADDTERDLATAARETARELRARGHRPAVIPFGGSNAVGAHGYRLAALEIVEQRPAVDHVVCAVGSGGTMAGLVAGLDAQRVLGVHVGAIGDARTQVAQFLHDMGSPVEQTELRIRADQIGDGYAELTAKAGEAMTTSARTEGLVLDPIYTARALGGLVDEIREGTIRSHDTVVFLASGGLPGLFGHPDVHRLLST